MIKKRIKNIFPGLYFAYIRLITRWRANSQSDREFVKEKFYRNFGQYPDLDNPKRYNEYISKILLTPPDPIMQKCVDKYMVREYVKEKIGDHILNDLLGVYGKVNTLLRDWENLPDKFALKATHGCGWNYICEDKQNVDLKHLKKLINHWLRSNFYYFQRELIYKNITPGIIAEKYLEDQSGGLMDYKIHCFQGEPQFINVIVDRFSNMKLNTYDTDWNFMDVSFEEHFPNDPDWKMEKPDDLGTMLEYSRKLAEPFNYVRVDFYLVDGKIYFGELTFTPGNGSYTSFSLDDDLFFGRFFKPESKGQKQS